MGLAEERRATAMEGAEKVEAGEGEGASRRPVAFHRPVEEGAGGAPRTTLARGLVRPSVAETPARPVVKESMGSRVPMNRNLLALQSTSDCTQKCLGFVFVKPRQTLDWVQRERWARGDAGSTGCWAEPSSAFKSFDAGGVAPVRFACPKLVCLHALKMVRQLSGAGTRAGR